MAMKYICRQSRRIVTQLISVLLYSLVESMTEFNKSMQPTANASAD